MRVPEGREALQNDRESGIAYLISDKLSKVECFSKICLLSIIKCLQISRSGKIKKFITLCMK